MNKRKIANIVIPVTLMLIIGIALYKVITIQMEYQEAEDEYRNLEAYIVEEPIEKRVPEPLSEGGQTETMAVISDAMPEEGFDEGLSGQQMEGEQGSAEFEEDVILHINEDGLRAINEDYCAWLRIPSLKINYPLAAGTDNEYYLHHTFEKKYNAAGCLFIDCETSSDFSDRNTFIYGHNMKNGSMFGGLKRFRREQGLCAADPYFYIHRENLIYQYEIFSYYKTDYTSGSYRLIHTEEEYDAYIADVCRLTEYVPARVMDFSGYPNIVTLSTCAGTGGTTERMVVHGVLVSISEMQ